MIVNELARASYEAYFRELAQAPVSKRGLIKQTVLAYLHGGGIGGPVTERSFVDAFDRLSRYIEEPDLFYVGARKAVEKLLEGRQQHLSREDRIILAANICASDLYCLNRLQSRRKGFLWANNYKWAFCYLPNPWYLDFPSYPKPLTTWPRTGDQYIRPYKHSMEEHIIRMISSQQQPVSLLDAGVGGGEYALDLKKRFGQQIHTVGVGLINQQIPVDQNLITPMEVLPLSWTGRFDVVVSNYALCYAVFPKIAISELLRVLKPGRSAFLDISSYWKGGDVYEIVRIMRECIEYGGGNAQKDFNDHYQGLESFVSIKSLIECWSSRTIGFSVARARPGDSRGFCIEVRKQKMR